MSYNIYKKKRWLETSKGDLLPLAYYANSSLRDIHGKYVYSWCIYNFCEDCILLNKEKFKKIAKERYEDEIERWTDYQLKCRTDEIFEPAGPESYCYFGNVYPGGGKMKNMRAFHSVRNTIPMQEYLSEHPYIHICMTAFHLSDYHTVEIERIQITNEADVYHAQAVYEKMKERNPVCGISLGVHGDLD